MLAAMAGSTHPSPGGTAPAATRATEAVCASAKAVARPIQRRQRDGA